MTSQVVIKTPGKKEKDEIRKLLKKLKQNNYKPYYLNILEALEDKLKGMK